MTIEQFLAESLVLLASAVVVMLVSYRLRIPAMVGLLLTGVLIGPSVLGLVGDPHQVELFAEIGVVFLLFAIGLEFSLERLREVRRHFFLGGSLQCGLTIGSVALVALLAFPPSQAVFLGFLIALSSTAIVLKLYNEQRVMEAPQGKTVLGMLLFQDFLIVPMIVLTPMLAGAVEASASTFAVRFGGSLLVVAVVFWVARVLMPKLLFWMASTRIRELLVLGAVTICLGMAWITHALGFSLALGAFIAGIIVSESEASHQVVAEVAPFRDVFTSIFFISIGMLVDVSFVADHLAAVLGLAAAIVGVKLATTGVAAAALGLPVRIVAVVALGLAQIGEFSFVLLQVGAENDLVAPDLYQTIIAAAVVTMLFTPAQIGIAPAVASRVAELLGRRRGSATAPTGATVEPEPGEGGVAPAADHVIVVGFGVNGQLLARVLREAGIRYRVVELNAVTVRRARAAGEPILYGDSTRREILEHAGIREARMVVFAISDLSAMGRSIQLARELAPDVHIVVRTRMVAQIEELDRSGADEIIAEEFETAIEVFTRVLARYHVPRNVIRAQTRVLRGESYRMLRAPRREEGVSEAVLEALETGTTDIFRLRHGSPAVGETLHSLHLRRRSGASVIAVVRGETSLANPDAELELEEGDTLVLVGSHGEIDRAMTLLEVPGETGSPAVTAE